MEGDLSEEIEDERSLEDVLPGYQLVVPDLLIVVPLVLKEEIMNHIKEEEEPLNDPIQDEEPEARVVLEGHSEGDGQGGVDHEEEHEEVPEVEESRI